MKLVYYTYRKISLLLFVLMAVWGVLFYYAIIDEVVDETDDTLENYAEILIEHVLHDSSLLETEGSLMSFYKFRPISEQEGNHYQEVFYDSTVYIELEDENEPVRVMRTAFRMPDGQFYELTLMISILERDDMVEAMLWYLGALFLLLLICTSVGIQVILKGVFRPLHKLLDWLHGIQPGKEVPALENPTKIREFRQLSEAAVDMGNRSYKAYEEQKQFIENASHELQTPLAIVRGKVELLAESDSLTEQQMKELDEIYSTLGRAVKLNKSLLLLMFVYIHQIRQKVFQYLVHRYILRLRVLPVLYTGKQQQGLVQFYGTPQRGIYLVQLLHLLFRHPFTLSQQFHFSPHDGKRCLQLMRGILDELLLLLVCLVAAVTHIQCSIAQLAELPYLRRVVQWRHLLAGLNAVQPVKQPM